MSHMSEPGGTMATCRVCGSDYDWTECPQAHEARCCGTDCYLAILILWTPAQYDFHCGSGHPMRLARVEDGVVVCDCGNSESIVDMNPSAVISGDSIDDISLNPKRFYLIWRATGDLIL